MTTIDGADRFESWLRRGAPNPDPHDQDGDLQLDIYDVPAREDEDDVEDEVAA